MDEHTWEWAELLGHWVLAWTLVVAAVAAWMRVSRPGRASVRYGAWLLATFAGLLLAPWALGVGPRISWVDVLAVVNLAPRGSTVDPVARFPSWFEGRPAVAGESASEESPGPERTETIAPVDPQTRRTAGVAEEERRDVASAAWPGAVVAVWAAGFLLFAVRLGRDALRVRALLREADREAPADLNAELEVARRDLGLRRRVRVLVHAGLPAPLCVGLFRPTLLWPTEESCPMTPSQRRASLWHELAHLRHGDDWVALLAEAWRCVSWFYLPVHLMIGCLRREREFRCDDVASSRSGGPERYARWLLDLAPVRVEPPALATSLVGGADLAVRVRRLLDGTARDLGPLSRRQVLMLGMLGLGLLGACGSVRLVGFVARAGESDAADAPLPEITPQELAAQIEKARQGYVAGLLEVEFDEERDATPFPRRNVDAPSTVKFPGRFQHASDGRLWRTEFDAKTLSFGAEQVVTRPYRWVTGFDGQRHYNWKVGGQNEVTLGDSNREALALEPRALFWSKHAEIIKSLKSKDVTIMQAEVDGVRCYVVRSQVKNDSGEWRSEYAISPRRSFLGVETSLYHNGQRYLWHRLRNIRQAGQGHWAPERIDWEWLSFRKDGTSQVEQRRAMRVVRYEPARAIAREDFSLKIPINATANDLTTGLSYVNDPWWPELGPLLRERFDWPPPDFSELRNVVSHCDGKIEGRPAPPVEASAWINSGPIDWAQERGKVVLIHLTSLYDDRKQTAAVRALADRYEAAGLRVLSLFDSSDDPDAVRQCVKELRLQHPVAIDRPAGERFGATMQALGMSYETSVFLVDHLGKVRQVKAPGTLIESVVQRLRDAGAQDVSAPSGKWPTLDREMSQAVQRSFQEWLTQADNGGSLVGTISDGEGLPLANAQVRLEAEARIQTGPGAQFIITSRAPRLAVTGGNGMFQFLDLAKGNYDILVSAPGHATIKRKAVIESKLGEVTFEAILSQADTIGGRVVDEAGKPVAGAEVTISEHQLAHSNGNVTHFHDVFEMKTTDAQGRFSFRKLPEGDYTLVVKGAGYSPQEAKHVPAGTNDLGLTLPHVRP